MKTRLLIAILALCTFAAASCSKCTSRTTCGPASSGGCTCTFDTGFCAPCGSCIAGHCSNGCGQLLAAFPEDKEILSRKWVNDTHLSSKIAATDAKLARLAEIFQRQVRTGNCITHVSPNAPGYLDDDTWTSHAFGDTIELSISGRTLYMGGQSWSIYGRKKFLGLFRTKTEIAKGSYD